MKNQQNKDLYTDGSRNAKNCSGGKNCDGSKSGRNTTACTHNSAKDCTHGAKNECRD